MSLGEQEKVNGINRCGSELHSGKKKVTVRKENGEELTFRLDDIHLIRRHSSFQRFDKPLYPETLIKFFDIQPGVSYKTAAQKKREEKDRQVPYQFVLNALDPILHSTFKPEKYGFVPFDL
jgi:hypothetical protein